MILDQIFAMKVITEKYQKKIAQISAHISAYH